MTSMSASGATSASYGRARIQSSNQSLSPSAQVLAALVAAAAKEQLKIPEQRMVSARQRVSADPQCGIGQVAEILGLTIRRVDIRSGVRRNDAAATYVVRSGESWSLARPGSSKAERSRSAGARERSTAQPRAAGRRPAVADAAPDQWWQVCPTLEPNIQGPRSVARFLWTSAGRRDLRLLLACALASAVLSTVVPLLSGRIVGELIPADEQSRIVSVAGVLLLVAASIAVLLVVQLLLGQRIAVRIDQRYTMALYQRLFALPTSFHRDHQAGELATRMTSLEVVTSAACIVIPVAVSSVSVLVGSLLVLGWLDIFAAFVSLSVFLVVLVIAVFAIRRLVAVSGRLNTVSLDLSGKTFAMLAGISKIRSSRAESRMNRIWMHSYGQQQALTARMGRQRITVSLLALLPAPVISLVVVVLFASGIDSQGLAAFTSMTAAATQAAAAVSALIIAMAIFAPAIPTLTATGPIVQTAVRDTAPDAVTPTSLSGSVDLTGVSFDYGSGVPVLNDVNLHIDEGSFVAIVGPSGGGKTTLLRVLVGVEQATAGQVTIGGYSIDRLSREALRRQFGVVPQNARLITGSIAENILFGAGSADIDDAWSAAEQVGLADFIRALPMGMLTVISDGAATFSGGERQRIMVARALVSKPSIVVLDEATSALDNLSQHVVMETLLASGSTRIVVAHRLSTVAAADVIHVVVAGRIVESGTYGELIAAGGHFTELAKRQDIG